MSIKKRLGTAEVAAIYSAANSAVWYSHNLAHRLASASPREEDFVATLVTNGVGVLATRWEEILTPKGISVRVSGVFCHGHPQVAFGVPRRRVELADLLIAHFHSTRTRTIARAILIQAKMSADATHKLLANDRQLALYANWPKFEFVTGGLEPGLRNLYETGKGSRYALILERQSYPEEIRWADQCPWGSCAAGRVLSADRSLAKLLGDILLDRDGRVVQFRKPKDDWSRTVKELLETTGKKTYKRKNIGRGDTPRLTSSGQPLDGIVFFSDSSNFGGAAALRSAKGVMDGLFSGASVDIHDADNGELPPQSNAKDDNGGGMSALIIETRESVG